MSERTKNSIQTTTKETCMKHKTDSSKINPNPNKRRINKDDRPKFLQIRLKI